MGKKCSRRRFLGKAGLWGAAIGLGAQRSFGPLIASEGRRRVNLKNVRHIAIDQDPHTSCGPPRQGGVKHFGDGEIAVVYSRTSSADKDRSRADVVLRRSRDSGETWPRQDDVTLWSDALPLEKRREFLCQDPAERDVLDMTRPEAMFFFGRTSLRIRPIVRNTPQGWTCQWTDSEAEEPSSPAWRTVFQIRSIDKGRTWERVPLVLEPPPKTTSFWKDNHPPVTMPDGALVGAFESDKALWLYGSECPGMTWQYLSLIAMEKPDVGRPTCAGLILLPSGRLQCYMFMVAEQSDSLCLSESDDCFSWTEPRPIARARHDPWPLRLRDGRIVVIFARRQRPAGIAAIVSEDDGKTWSDATTIRADASGPDIGGPVATEIDNGRIFAAYQCSLSAGASFIGGAFFELC